MQLGSASQELLTPRRCRQQAFVEEQRSRDLTTTVATCMETLKKDIEEEDAVSMLVVGTENGLV